MRRRDLCRYLAALVLAAAGCAGALLLPPHEPGSLRAPDLVEIVELDPTVHLDMRYATPHNFIGQAVYSEARAFLQRPAAEALVRAHRALAREGLGILVYDAYRPWSVTRRFWELTPKAQHAFVADPRKGSKHNRGCAADISLYRLDTGAPVAMPSDFDDMSLRASPQYAGGTAEARALRDRLRAAMEQEGFTVEPNEWWHFNYRDWRQYPILDVPFADVRSGARVH
jgi:D-alanyl-D-alanine dipeptidase